ALGFRAERHLDRGRNLLAEHRPAFDFLAYVLEGQMRTGKNPAGKALTFPDQSEEEMFGLNGVAAKLAGLVPGEEEHATGTFGVPFEHPASLGESRWCWGHIQSHHIIRHGRRPAYGIVLDKSLPALGFPPHTVRRSGRV